MNRQEKQSVIDAVKDDFQRSQAIVHCSMQGMNVERYNTYAVNSMLRMVP